MNHAMIHTNDITSEQFDKIDKLCINMKAAICKCASLFS